MKQHEINVDSKISPITSLSCGFSCRKVKGSDLVGEHERSLQELFPMEAPSLLAYVEHLGKTWLAWETDLEIKVESNGKFAPQNAVVRPRVFMVRWFKWLQWVQQKI